MPEFLKSLKSMVGLGPKDVNLPDEKKGKPVPSVKGGMTTGGSPDDKRWVDLRRRQADQSIKQIQDFAQTIHGPKRRKP